jgi:hypothetical protein
MLATHHDYILRRRAGAAANAAASTSHQLQTQTKHKFTPVGCLDLAQMVAFFQIAGPPAASTELGQRCRRKVVCAHGTKASAAAIAFDNRVPDVPAIWRLCRYSVSRAPLLISLGRVLPAIAMVSMAEFQRRGPLHH